MQYYIKIFNRETGEFVGYYKEIGKNCITSMLNGTKFFDTLDDALLVAREHDGGFLRDKSKKYYTAVCTVYCDSTRNPKIKDYDNKVYSEEEKEDAINTIIRENNRYN